MTQPASGRQSPKGEVIEQVNILLTISPLPACGRGWDPLRLQWEGEGMEPHVVLFPLPNHATFCGPKSRVPLTRAEGDSFIVILSAAKDLVGSQ